MPYKKVKGWSWESFWIIGGLFSWLVVPPLAAYLTTIPGFMDIIRGSSSSVLVSTFVMGLLWGIGGLTYGLGVRYLGVSLGSSIILGLCSFFGALVPAVYYYFNPKTGKEVPITPRRVLVFRPSNIMKDRINSGLGRRKAAE